MKQIIPFVKDVVFKDKIAMITSISLEHEEKVLDGEISGDFVIYGDYKVHADTTEKELFKYRLPFTAILPDNIDKNSVIVDIKDFTYDLKEEDVVTVSIDFSVEGEEIEVLEEVEEKREEEEVIEENIPLETINKEIDAFLEEIEEPIVEERTDDKEIIQEVREESTFIENKEENLMPETIEIEKEEMTTEETKSEYITYHIHIVGENETLEQIMQKYETNLDYIKMYNDITNLTIGDKLIIPDKEDE